MSSGCRVIKKEKREINRFIQLNSKVQKKEDRFKSRSSKGHLIWRPGISDEIISFKFKKNRLKENSIDFTEGKERDHQI